MAKKSLLHEPSLRAAESVTCWVLRFRWHKVIYVNWLEAAFLGLVQGLTEFLPISSSAHLFIVGKLIGLEDPGAGFTAVSQLGTEAAVVVFFWRDIVRIVKHWWLSLSENCRVTTRMPGWVGW